MPRAPSTRLLVLAGALPTLVSAAYVLSFVRPMALGFDASRWSGLLAAVDGPPQSDVEVPPGQLTPRGSTAPPRADRTRRAGGGVLDLRTDPRLSARTRRARRRTGSRFT